MLCRVVGFSWTSLFFRRLRRVEAEYLLVFEQVCLVFGKARASANHVSDKPLGKLVSSRPTRNHYQHLVDLLAAPMP